MTAAVLAAPRGVGHRRLALLASLGALAAWQVLATVAFGPQVLPSPVAVASQMWADRAFYPPHIAKTLSEAAVGYAWGVSIALAIGALFVLVPVVERVALRIVVATYCLPLIATAPILQIVLSPDAAKSALAAQATLLVTLVGVTLGLRAADPAHLDVVHCAGGGRFHKLVKARLRAAVPGIFTGLKIAAPSALLGAIIGEFLGGFRGLGVALIISQQSFFVERTWGLTIVMGALAAAGYGLTALVARLLVPWQTTSTLSFGPAAPAVGTSAGRRLATSVAYLVASLALTLGLWVAAIDVFDLNPFFAKQPGEVWHFLAGAPTAAVDRAELFSALRITFANAALGYATGTVGALLLAIVVVANRAVEQTVMPLALWVRSVPLVAMTPLIALIFGRGLATTLVMAGLVTFFPSLVNLVDGLRAVPTPALDVARAYGLRRWATMAKVRMPYALPSLFASARIAGPMAVLGAILAEWLATGEGVGNYMVVAQATSRYTAVWASVAVLTAASVAVYATIAALENTVIRRFAGHR